MEPNEKTAAGKLVKFICDDFLMAKNCVTHGADLYKIEFDDDGEPDTIWYIDEGDEEIDRDYIFESILEKGWNLTVVGSRALQGGRNTSRLEATKNGDNIHIKLYDIFNENHEFLILERNL